MGGKADEAMKGSVFWHMSAMDLFALFMTIFSFVFFCASCCCFFRLCCADLNGGVVDEEMALEKAMKKQYAAKQMRGRGGGRGREEEEVEVSAANQQRLQ